MSDPFVDMRPNHDHNHWITKWIRSYVTPAAEREELNRIGLLEIQAGAAALCVRISTSTFFSVARALVHLVLSALCVINIF
jgi:hypothetical protein